MPWRNASNKYLQHIISWRNKKNMIWVVPNLIWSYITYRLEKSLNKLQKLGFTDTQMTNKISSWNIKKKMAYKTKCTSISCYFMSFLLLKTCSDRHFTDFSTYICSRRSFCLNQITLVVIPTSPSRHQAMFFQPKSIDIYLLLLKNIPHSIWLPHISL